MEVEEGQFQCLQGPPSFGLAYAQLVLAALRQFPYLSKVESKVEKGLKSAILQDANYISLFYRRAIFLGFRSPAII